MTPFVNDETIHASGMGNILERSVLAIQKSCDRVSSLPTKQIEVAIIVDVGHTAVCDFVAGRARPLATVTSVNVPLQLFLSSDRRSSEPPTHHAQQQIPCSRRCCSRPASRFNAAELPNRPAAAVRSR